MLYLETEAIKTMTNIAKGKLLIYELRIFQESLLNHPDAQL